MPIWERKEVRDDLGTRITFLPAVCIAAISFLFSTPGVVPDCYLTETLAAVESGLIVVLLESGA